MELTHSFTVPGTVAETWDRFGDIASLAECFPGAQVTSVSDDSFEGTVKVKLGPIALVYTGSGTFVSKDEAAHSFVVEAKGRDKRGNGTAGATVTVSMGDSAGTADGTDVTVRTDLAITGKPAQFGRGVMQDVSDKLLGQFVACLEQRSGGGEQATVVGSESVAGSPPASSSGEQATVVGSESVAGSPPASSSGEQATAPPQQTVAGSPPADDALDLGATVLPVLVRGYWKQAAAGVAVLAFLIWLIRRMTDVDQV